MALTAAQVMAQDEAFIPFDCYTESNRRYGNANGTKITDKDLISGLDINDARLVAIAACSDMNTKLISGITTTWGVWDSELNQWSNVKAMNTIGFMSGLQEFDDISAASAAGVSLNQDADWALQQYWYQEASPDQKQFYMDRAADSINATARTTERQNLFNAADVD